MPFPPLSVKQIAPELGALPAITLPMNKTRFAKTKSGKLVALNVLTPDATEGFWSYQINDKGVAVRVWVP